MDRMMDGKAIDGIMNGWMGKLHWMDGKARGI